MSVHFGNYTQQSDDITCPRCGRKGSVTWEKTPVNAGGKEFVSVQGGFYERLGRKAPYAIELVCNGCGTAQIEQTSKP